MKISALDMDFLRRRLDEKVHAEGHEKISEVPLKDRESWLAEMTQHYIDVVTTATDYNSRKRD